MINPLVSVIIPTYNRTDYLKITLNSILKQTFQDFEIIVVDDGTPGTANQNLCASFDKVRYVKIENSGGPAKPRNVGIKEAKGKYLAFVDDDDLWLPNKLEKQVAVLESNPDFGLVHGCCEIIDEKGILQNRIIGRPGTPEVKHGDVSMRMMGNWTVMMPTSFVKKEIVQKVGFFNEKIPSALEDVEFWVRCSFETKFFYIDEPLVQYRVHNENISANHEKYLELPLYLKKVLLAVYSKGKISSGEYKILLNRLCIMELKMLRFNYVQVFKNLFALDRFWFFNFINLKLLVRLHLNTNVPNK